VKEYIICSAIWFKDGNTHEHQPKNINSGFVICGRRHHNCYITAHILLNTESLEWTELDNTAIQGFLTNTDRFVDRDEAFEIAKNVGQVKSKKKKLLFSEDLY